jgi:hypothetical protein
MVSPPSLGCSRRMPAVEVRTYCRTWESPMGNWMGIHYSAGEHWQRDRCCHMHGDGKARAPCPRKHHGEELEGVEVAQQHNLRGCQLKDTRQRLQSSGRCRHSMRKLCSQMGECRVERLQVFDDPALVKLLTARNQSRGDRDADAAAEVTCQVDRRRGVTGALLWNRPEGERIVTGIGLSASQAVRDRFC